VDADPQPIPADPLPEGIVEGDSAETDEWDREHGDEPPKTMRGIRPRHISLEWLPTRPGRRASTPSS